MANEVVKKESELPAEGDGFDAANVQTRVIRGRILKFVDGRLTVDGQPFAKETELTVQNVARVAQCWREKIPIDSFFIDAEHPVTMIDRLNENFPKETWEDGLDGKPKPPWVLNYVVWFIDEVDGSRYTMLNSTVGMARAWEDLVDRVKTMRALRGRASFRVSSFPAR